MRRAARTDSNHAEIIAQFRKFGCSVWDTHALGNGGVDCVVAKFGKNILVEIKDGNKMPSERKLTADEEKFHAGWLGAITIVEDLSDVISVVKGLEK